MGGQISRMLKTAWFVFFSLGTPWFSIAQNISFLLSIHVGFFASSP
jgi:hypothetical protein